MTRKIIEFSGKIIASRIGSGGAYVEFPFDVKDCFGKTGRIKVVCRFEGIEYRGSLVKMGTDCHILGISKDIRKKLSKEIGDSVTVQVREDHEERVVEIPPDLADILKSENLLQAFQGLSPSKRKEAVEQVSSAKKEETRKKRIQQVVESLR